MPAGKGPALDLIGFLAPGLQHVIEKPDRSLRAPQGQQGRLDSLGRILGIMLEIDAGRRAVILADGMAGLGV